MPVLGLCFGGQVLAHVLGGRIEAAPTPEFGWHEIETDEPDAIPAGPWLLWHYQRFTVPPGATEVARTEHATQAFRHGRHLGLQFHPESTTDIVEGWARKDAEKLQTVGVDERPGADRRAGRAQGCGEAGGVPPVRRLHRRERMIEERGLMARPPELSDQSVTSVRVVYSDLHGVTRGKDVPIGEFDRAAEHGLAFCSAIMGTDLRHTPVVGGEQGYPDLIAKPDLSTLTLLPWEPGVACCIADLEPVSGTTAAPADPRGAVRKAVAGFEELGYAPIVGPELEFFLCVADPAAPNGIRRYVDNLSMVYTVGPQADPKGVVRQITEALSRLGMGTFAANHEFMNSQYEINLRHAPALTAADRAFRLKSAVKDVAAIHGLIATFMGKPFNDQGGSGFHFHFSLDREDDNAFADHDDADGVSDVMRHFTAGILAHAHALTAFLNPTVNAYRRLVPGQPRADPRQLGLGQPHELHPHPGRARARVARRGARRRRQREPVPRHRRDPVRRPARRARQARARPARRRRRLHARRPGRAAAHLASTPRSTRSRPTTSCATRWARRSSTRSWP